MIYQFGVVLLVGTWASMSAAMPQPCVCTLEYAPICGTNGVTYPNKCSFECDRGEATMAYKGVCKSKRQSLPPCACTRDVRPVCGSDGRTYSNPCLLNCAKEDARDLHVEHVGRCVTQKREVPQGLPSCACTRDMHVVCASNGLTYNNECLMRCAGAELEVDHEGPCDAD